MHCLNEHDLVSVLEISRLGYGRGIDVVLYTTQKLDLSPITKKYPSLGVFYGEPQLAAIEGLDEPAAVVYRQGWASDVILDPNALKILQRVRQYFV